MHTNLAPSQQAIAFGRGADQDAVHEANASIRSGERTFVIADGVMYKIGEEPAAGQHFGLGFPS